MTNRLLSAAFAVTTVLIAGQASAAALSGPVFNPANGHTYYLLDQADWVSSEAQAISLGGHLVTINNAAEDAFVFASFGSFGGLSRELAIGLTDAAVEGSFVWTSGELVTYMSRPG